MQKESPNANQSELAYLQLLHLADSAFPIGALAHSFGLETLVSATQLRPTTLELFLQGYLEEAGVAAIAGAAFGPAGKNYVRFSLVSARNLLQEALERIERVSIRWRAAVSR